MAKILDVNNLRISFRTNNGKVKAVRDITFSLDKGETLAIVGESGSGKSVTSRAIMGILAPNAIVESGEILYDGQDLLKIPEEIFQELRGEKVSMIFQDPLSSLNPIVKIGKQLTETMIIKGKSRQKAAKKQFKKRMIAIKHYLGLVNPSSGKENEQMIAKFRQFEAKHSALENAFNIAKDSVVLAGDRIEYLQSQLLNKAYKNVHGDCADIVKLGRKAVHEYVINKKADDLNTLLNNLDSVIKCGESNMFRYFISHNFLKVGNLFRRIFKKPLLDKTDYDAVKRLLPEIKLILDEANDLPTPNFFAMGYYLEFSGQPLPKMEVNELNIFLREYLDKEFMLNFIEHAKNAIICSYNESIETKKTIIDEIKRSKSLFDAEHYDKKTINAFMKHIIELANRSLDPLAIKKDSAMLSFKSSLRDEVNKHFFGQINNLKEQKKFDKASQKHKALCDKGKIPDWKVTPAALMDLKLVRENIASIFDKAIESFEADVAKAIEQDFDQKTVEQIDFLKLTGSTVVKKVTKELAKLRALKIMEEVGIPEPRKRFNQYPFQFSGGMRQRIVIAIALSVLPDILICDEPTTALDVTIQSQILELINGLKEKHNLSVIFITHDLGVVANMADRVAVMYAGKIVEYGTADDIFYSPAHPYTWALLSSMPDLETREKLEAIPGVPPNMIFPPKGDAFAARNKYAMKIDFEEQPPMFKISDTHYAATWLLHPDAPKVEMPKIVKERIERNKKHFEQLATQQQKSISTDESR